MSEYGVIVCESGHSWTGFGLGTRVHGTMCWRCYNGNEDLGREQAPYLWFTSLNDAPDGIIEDEEQRFKWASFHHTHPVEPPFEKQYRPRQFPGCAECLVEIPTS